MKEEEQESFQGKSVEVARVQDVPAGKIKHVEIDGKEIAIANIDGKYYAFDDRCGHSSARLSMGTVNYPRINPWACSCFNDRCTTISAGVTSRRSAGRKCNISSPLCR